MARGARKSGTEATGGASPFGFSYEEFTDWYGQLRSSLLEPARVTFVRLLNERLDQEMIEFDRHRIRVASSRVKNPARTWAKLTKERYSGQIVNLGSILTVIDDLVGIRVVCNNLCDIDYLRNVLSDLPVRDDDPSAALALEPESEKQYVDVPKESGYRAYHINLVTVVPGLSGLRQVRGELQVRTLLQDGWGELTHEDTYKPGMELPPLIVTLSRRMADLLATVDDLAQDLREELDRLAQAADAEPGSVEQAQPADQDALANAKTAAETPAEAEPWSGESFKQALLDETRRAVEELSRPAPLASVAQRVRSVIGTAITDDWGGYKSFKALVRAAVPGVRILDSAPGIIIPLGQSAELQYEEPPTDDGIPGIIVALHRYDKNLPAIPPDRLGPFYRALADVLDPQVWRELEVSTEGPGILGLNRLSRYGRDTAEKRGEKVSRPHLDYVLKSLMWSGNLRPGMPVEDAKEVLADWLLARATAFGLVTDSIQARETIHNWLNSDPG
jgi:ppGpp synthetase/RelA/SpoT-type nucleotidyltranferase